MNISSTEMARLIGLVDPSCAVDPDYILQVERGHKNPSYELMCAWSKVIGVDVGDVHLASELGEMILDADPRPATTTGKRPAGKRQAAGSERAVSRPAA